MNRDLEQYRDVAIKSLAVLGLMTILALGSFLTLTVLSYIPKAVRSIGSFVASTTPEVGTAVVSVTNAVKGDLGFKSNKTSIESASAVTLSWDKTSAELEGSYALTSPCMSGVSISYKGTSLSCNVPFYINQDAEEIKLTINSKKVRSVEVPLTLRFTKNEEASPSRSDSVKIEVTNGTIAKDETKASTPVFSVISSYVYGYPSYVGISTNKPISSEWGQADLRPVVLEVGIIDPVTKVLIPTSYMSRTSKAAIRFSIENVGTKTSQPWVFNAILPTSPRYTYLPEFQPPLKPGERIEYTLTFDRIVADYNAIVITVDPAETLPEATKANNSVTANFTAF